MTHKVCQNASSVALIANGVIHDYAFIFSLIQNYDCRIAVDGGLVHCHAMGIIPDLIVGDLDSTSSKILDLYPNVPKEVFPADKDETDMELAIQAANAPGVKKIAFFGALENRTDHTLVNLLLLNRLPKKIVIESEKETLICIEGKNVFHCYPGQIVSLIPVGSPAKVTTNGLKWELKNSILNQNFFSLSNVCLNSHFEVTVEQGSLICCLIR